MRRRGRCRRALLPVAEALLLEVTSFSASVSVQPRRVVIGAMFFFSLGELFEGWGGGGVGVWVGAQSLYFTATAGMDRHFVQ